MSYTIKNYPSKVAVKRDLKAGIEVTCYQPGLGHDLTHYTGTVSLEGPHYPAAHRWYGTGMMKDGILKSIK